MYYYKTLIIPAVIIDFTASFQFCMWIFYSLFRDFCRYNFFCYCLTSIYLQAMILIMIMIIIVITIMTIIIIIFIII